MNVEQPTPLEEHLTPLLVACDKALAAGTALPDTSGEDTPPDLRAHLEQGLACMQLLREVLLRRRSVAAAASSADLPGTCLGRFEIRRELGRGAFGMVFQAYDTQLGRDVALKVPRPEALVTPELRQRFVREARAAAGLDHPNLVPVYEAGEVGPVCYIASAYCPGITLAEWLKERSAPVPVHTAARLVAQLAAAVQHAHSRGVIHRDLKPSNVLLQLGPESKVSGPDSTLKEPGTLPGPASPELEFVPKVADFGLAKLKPATPVGAGAESSSPTHSGAILGTPSYMAPEQARGRNEQVGSAADVYALGVILYELLVGRPPFRGETALETLEQVRSQEPMSPRRLRPRLPRDLDTICLKCLQKEPHKRYLRAQALADDLQSFLAGAPIQARPIGPAERLWRWCRRKPALAAVSVALVVVLSAGLSGMTWQWRRAEDEWRRAEQNLKEARAIVRRHFIDLSDVELSKEPGTQKWQKKLLGEALDYYRQFLDQHPDDPAMLAEVAGAHYRVALITGKLDSPEKTEAEFEQAREILEKVVRNNPADSWLQSLLMYSYLNIGTLQLQTARHAEALQNYQQAQTMLEQLVRANPTETRYQSALARCYRSIGFLQSETRNNNEAFRFNELARGHFEKLVHAHPTVPEYQADLADTYGQIGILQDATQQFNEARGSYEREHDLRQKLLQAHPVESKYQFDLSKNYANTSVLLSNMGKLSEALHSSQRAAELLEVLVRNNPDDIAFQASLANSYLRMGELQRRAKQLDHALESLERARGLFEKLVQAQPAVTEFQIGLAAYHLNQGLVRGKSEPRIALDEFARSIGMAEAIFRKEPRHVKARDILLKARWGRAWILGEVENHAEAVAEWNRALELDDGSYQDRLRLQRARSLARVGQHVQATAEANALANQKSVSGETLYGLACIVSLSLTAVRQDAHLSATEQDEQAEQYAARAVELLTKAHALQYFEESAKVEHLKEDKDLAPLRSHEDYQKLLRSLEGKE